MKKILIILTILLAFLVRFWRLDNLPAQLNIDEVAMGYSAYSILLTGHDEWGKFMPLSFASVGDYKTPIPIYLMALSEKIFGLNQFGIRFFPSLFSFLAIFVYFYIAKKYFYKHQEPVYLLLLLLSLSPWAIYFARYGYEVNELLLWFGLYLLVFFKFLTNPKPWQVFSLGTLYLISSLTYNPAKLFIPLLSLIVWFHHTCAHKLFGNYLSLLKNPTTIVIISLLLFLFYPFFTVHLFGEGAMRARSVFISNDYEYARVFKERLSILPLFQLNSIFILFSFWWQRLLEYFSPNFYLFTGLLLTSPEQFGVGVSNLAEYVLFIIGIISLLRQNNKQDLPIDKRMILLGWFILGLIPASLANNPQQPLRSLVSYPAYIFICFEGLLYLFGKTRSYLLYLPLLFLYIFGLFKSADFYLVHFPVQLYESKHYGWLDMAKFVNDHAKEYDKVIVDPRFGRAGPYIVGVPHLYFLYQSKYDPSHYQSQIATQSGKTNFDNIYFENINWFSYDHSQNTLYVGSPWSFPLRDISPQQIIYSVKYLDGYQGLLAVTNRIK